MVVAIGLASKLAWLLHEHGHLSLGRVPPLPGNLTPRHPGLRSNGQTGQCHVIANRV